MRVKPKPFKVERRALARPPKPLTQAEVHAIGVAAVEVALRPTADDVARLLEGRTNFPKLMWGDVQ